MIGFARTARVICTVLVETLTLAALVAIGRRPELSVPVGHLGSWLRDGDPATVVVAVLRWVALVGAGWLLVSTVLYVAAAVTRVPAAVRAVGWTTLPAARRAVDAACAVSVTATIVLTPAVAGATRAGDPPGVSVVRDGRNHDGSIAGLPPDPAFPTPIAPTPVAPPSVTPASVTPASVTGAPAVDAPPPYTGERVLAAGDDLWTVAAAHLADVSGRVPADLSDAEVAPYWVRVCDANRARLASGDPNLVFPGERITLPPV